MEIFINLIPEVFLDDPLKEFLKRILLFLTLIKSNERKTKIRHLRTQQTFKL